MSLQLAAQHLASRGRGEDKMLVHMTPHEVHGLQALAMAHGGSLTINPETGLPEAGFLKKILPMLAGMALNFIAPGVGLAVGEALMGVGAAGAGAVGTGLVVGGATGLATGSLQKGIMAGLGAYGGAGLAEGLVGMGANAAQQAAMQQLTPSQIAEVLQNENMTLQGAKELAAEQAKSAFMAKPAVDQLGAGLGAFKDAPLTGLKTLVKPALAAAAPIIADQAVQSQMPKTTTSPTAFVTPYSFDPYTGGLSSLGRWKPEEFPGFSGAPVRAASGGAVALADGGFTDAQVAQALKESMGQGFSMDQSIGGAADKYGISQEQLSRAQALMAPPAQAPAPAPADNTPSFDYIAPQQAAPVPQATPTPQQLSAQQAIVNDPVAAARQAVTSGVQSGMTDQQIADMVNAQYGKSFDAGNVAAFMDTQGIARPAQAPTPTPTPTPTPAEYLTTQQPTQAAQPAAMPQAPALTPTAVAALQGLSKDQLAQVGLFTQAQQQELAVNEVKRGVVLGATPEGIAETINSKYDKDFTAEQVQDFITNNGLGIVKDVKKPVVPSPIALAELSNVTSVLPGTTGAGQPYTPTTADVTKQYTQGGGSTGAPELGTVQPTERVYPQNTVYQAVSSYLAANPNAIYGDIGNLARTLGIPIPQLRAAVNEHRFNSLTGASKSAYDYLMGRGAYPVNQTLPAGASLARPYYEASGISSSASALKPAYLTPTTPAAAPAAPRDTLTTPSGNALTEGQRMQLGNMFVQAQSTGDYTGFNAMLQSLRLNKTDLLNLFPSLTDAGVNEWIASGKINMYEPTSAAKAGGLMAAMAEGGSARVNPLPSMQDDDLQQAYDVSLKRQNTAQQRKLKTEIDLRDRLRNVQMYSLGGYSDGGRLLRGPGDGVSDDIPATIGDRQPARLADGEFVVPARIVSEIGNGSTEAGARKLYAMMDRVQRVRKKTTGKDRVATDTKAEQYLPA